MVEWVLFETRMGRWVVGVVERVTGLAVLVEDGWRIGFVPVAMLERLRCGRPSPEC